MPKPRRRPPAAAPARPCLLPPGYDAVIEGDRRFFDRHTGRCYRIRHTAAVELAAATALGQTFAPLSPGARWFTAVRQVAAGARVRAFFQAHEAAEVDLPEAVARGLFEACSGPDGQRIGELLERAVNEARDGR